MITNRQSNDSKQLQHMRVKREKKSKLIYIPIEKGGRDNVLNSDSWRVTGV